MYILGRRFDTGQGNKIASQLLSSRHILVGEGQICAFNTDRYYSKYRKDRGISRLLRRGRDSMAINAVGSAPYCFPKNRLPTGRY